MPVPEAKPEAKPEQTHEEEEQQHMTQRDFFPPLEAMSAVANYYTEEIIGEAYAMRFQPGLVLTPAVVTVMHAYHLPLITKHTLLRELSALRKVWRLWFNPASSVGFNAVRLMKRKLISEMFGFSDALGIPGFTQVAHEDAPQKLEALSSKMGELAQKHWDAMQRIVPVWMSALESVRKQDAETIKRMRHKHKTQAQFRVRTYVNHDKSKPISLWEKELREQFQKNLDSLKLLERIPAYETPKENLKKFMQEHIMEALLTHVEAWREPAYAEARVRSTSFPEAPEPMLDMAPYIWRVQYWVEAECADLAALVHIAQAGDALNNATLARIVFASELHLRKMQYLVKQMSLVATESKEGVEPPELRVARLLAVPGPSAQVPIWVTTEDSLLDEERLEEARARLTDARYKRAQDESKEKKDMADRVFTHPRARGTFMAYVEVQLEDDVELIKRIDLKLNQKQRKGGGGKKRG